ncbi:MAG TPA: hypothetical protein VEG31_00850 [Thermoproteota archaeon]|nr:hypothetical protein [Thermoproteota archaeon]
MTEAAEELVEAWRKERESEDLSDLPSDSMDKIRSALRKARESNYGRDRSGPTGKLRTTEMELVRFVSTDIVYCRTLKTLLREQEDGRVYSSPDRHILVPVTETKKIVQDTLEGLERGHTAAVQTPFRVWAAEEIIVTKAEKVDQFVDEWGRKHGPYHRREIVVLPKKYAEILISQGLASRISPH